ncbi:dephospho-CoA kinase [Arcicella sp. DC2W]|uniref:Dephospho-CoA kinase n=1 Tax=Arcicella gelida TaxID=2984195 RepID=A0ABU5S0N7_9BACT|nr:dephospho-CoA kinase [Arcicella sp. DC2W]MEA5401868.1 dephospho-CoA kinase [Arcicella sp. DC2W]
MGKVIGITGGIGSGKSIICKIFSILGVPIYEADTRAKWLITNNVSLKASIVQLLGENAYKSNGDYHREWVASEVFNKPDLLLQLNALVHPAVHQDAREWIANNQHYPFVLYEAALMKAAGNGNVFDKVIVVTCPLSLRIERVKQRDKRSVEEIEAIIARQLPDEERLKIADFIIYNDEKTSLIEQVLALYYQLLGKTSCIKKGNSDK